MPGISVVPLSAIVRAPAGTVDRRRGARGFDALAAHDDDPSGVHRLAVEHAIGLQDDRWPEPALRGAAPAGTEQSATTASESAMRMSSSHERLRLSIQAAK